jgi:glycosyltransferase involved in cell wall biosynthesis
MANMLSVIIITKNEAHNIAQCIGSVMWADEIIVLDSGSVDETVTICRQYTDHVYETDWPGFGLQKQRALAIAKGDWVLSVDADEVVSAELRSEIEKAIQTESVNGYEIPRLSSYCGKQLRHGGWWPDFVLRLFRRKHGHFTESLVHERIIVQGQIGRMNTPLLHNSYENLDEVLRKVNAYSSLGAETLFQKGVRSSLRKAILRAVWMFVRTYILKLALLEGRHGLMHSISSAESVYYKYMKLLELQDKNYAQ